MAQSLRDKQKLMARELILQAAADEIAESGLEQLTLQSVATRAGVSKRTLYNYFESREMLLEQLNRWSDELTIQMGGQLVPESLDTLPEVLQAVWRTWDQMGTVHTAANAIDAASNEGISPSRQRRRDALAEAVQAINSDLTDDQAKELGLMFHAVVSAPVFQRLTTQDGLNVNAAGNLAAWTIAVMRDSLKKGDTPYPKES